MIALKLHRIAHGRTGDKGNRLNASVIAYHPDAWPILLDQVTEARVLALFRHRGAQSAKRYALQRLHALNFVIDDALEGGVNAGLALDAHGKTLSFHVLGLTVQVPDDLAARITRGPDEAIAGGGNHA